MSCPLTASANLTSRLVQTLWILAKSTNRRTACGNLWPAKVYETKALIRCDALDPRVTVNELETQAPPADCFLGHDFGKEKGRWLRPWPAKVPPCVLFFFFSFLGGEYPTWSGLIVTFFLPFFGHGVSSQSRDIFNRGPVPGWCSSRFCLCRLSFRSSDWLIISVMFMYLSSFHTANPCWKLNGYLPCGFVCLFGIRFFFFPASWILSSLVLKLGRLPFKYVKSLFTRYRWHPGTPRLKVTINDRDSLFFVRLRDKLQQFDSKFFSRCTQ